MNLYAGKDGGWQSRTIFSRKALGPYQVIVKDGWPRGIVHEMTTSDETVLEKAVQLEETIIRCSAK